MSDNQQESKSKRQLKIEHRNEYYNLLIRIVSNNYKNLNTLLIFRFICNLQNWGVYKRYDASEFYYWYFHNRKDLIEKLNEYLEEEKHQQNIYFGMKTVIKQIEATKTFEAKYFYSEFIDDLEMLLGYKVKMPFFNFLYPNIFIKEAEEKTAIFLYKLESKNFFK